VQGVGFRYFIRDLAERSSLEGWVRNRDDGAVECVLQGARDLLERVEAALWEGPPWAEVTAVESDWGAPGEDLGGFRVLG
jgi:acylphosphatase